MMKSIISDIDSPKEEVLQRISDVINCGTLVEETVYGNTTILMYVLGKYNYYITLVHGALVAFELVGVYCFKF